jgi:hypothetical protein
MLTKNNQNYQVCLWEGQALATLEGDPLNLTLCHVAMVECFTRNAFEDIIQALRSCGDFPDIHDAGKAWEVRPRRTVTAYEFGVELWKCKGYGFAEALKMNMSLMHEVIRLNQGAA